MKYVLGIDFGGGASKATLLREDGVIAATATEEYKTISIGSGGREQSPKDWYDATVKNIQSVVEKAKIDTADIVCLCFDAATHTAVLMDENFRVVRDSVYWTDTRSLSEKRFLEENYADDIMKRFKHKVDTIWTLPELMWVKNNEPDVWAKVKKITFAKDYVRHLFTGDFVTDYIEAEGSMFFDFDTKDWADEYVSLLGLTRENLPTVVSPGDTAGCVTEDAAAATGLAAGTKVICGSTDTAMEVFAAGAIHPGQTTLKLATAGRICVVSDKLAPDRNTINYSHIIDGLYYPGTATKSCAASLRWFRDAFGGDFREFDDMAAGIPIGCEGLLFHPYLSGELTPFGNPNLRGSFIGISGTHQKAHFVRAVLEGVALSMMDCKEYLADRGVTIASAFAIGGGAKSALWRQIVADALGIELIRTENNDSSFGAAMLAGISAGIFRDYEDALARCTKIIDRTLPNPENRERYDTLFARYKKVQRAIAEIYEN